MKNLFFILIGLILSFSSLVSQQNYAKSTFPVTILDPCTITIDNSLGTTNVISGAIATAPSGAVICVDAGYYLEILPLDVPIGVTLRLSPGVELNIFQRLDVFGTFESLGNSALNVYINFANTAYMGTRGKVTCNHTIFQGRYGGTWKGISVMDRTSDNSIFDHCEIKDVLPSNASAALAIHGAYDVIVRYCDISNLLASSNGLTSSIYVSHKSQGLRFFKNKFHNSNHGVVVDDESYVSFNPSLNVISCANGNNIITQNRGDGIHANNYSYVNLNSPNYNFNNISNNVGYNAVAWGHSTIYAQENYWGPNIPPDTPKVFTIDGYIAWYPTLSCQPASPQQSVGGVIDDNGSVTIGMLNKVTNTASIDELLQTAFNLLDSENYIEALNIFKSIISISGDNERVYGHALIGISAICKVAQKDEKLGLDYKEILEYLKVCSKSDGALPIAKLVYAGTLPGLGYNDEAISEYEAIAKSYHGTNYEIRALIGVTSTYLFNKEDLVKAREVLEKAEKVAKVLKKEDDLSLKFLRGRIDADISYSNLDNAMRLLVTAIDLCDSKNYDEALKVFKLIIETPELRNCDYYQVAYGQALAGISRVCGAVQYADEELGLGDYKEILEYLKAHTKDDKNADYRVIYAGTLVKAGHYYEALSEFDEILEMATITDDNKRRILSWLWFIYEVRQWESEKAAEILAKIKVIEDNLNGIVSVDNPTDLPTDYSLSQNYPNPFNPTTTIQYSIPKDEFVKLTVYDITGKVVKELVNGHKAAGRYSVEFNASSYSSGIYYYKIEAGQYNSTQKMMLVK
jgi:tetratricopeptide (TPR) repeat protein